MQVRVFALGYVGCPTPAGLRRAGRRVVGVRRIPHIVLVLGDDPETLLDQPKVLVPGNDRDDARRAGRSLQARHVLLVQTRTPSA